MSDCKKTTKCPSPKKKKPLCKKGGPPKGAIKWPAIEFPHFLRTIGPRQIEAGKNFIPSLVVFSVTATLGILYFTEFRTVLQYVPYYGGKYPAPKDD